MLLVRSWWGFGGSAGGSACDEDEEHDEDWAAGGTDRLCGSGTGRRHGLLRSYTLYGGGVLFSRRTSRSSEAELGTPRGRASAAAEAGPWSAPRVPYSVAEASDTLQRLSEEMPLL